MVLDLGYWAVVVAHCHLGFHFVVRPYQKLVLKINNKSGVRIEGYDIMLILILRLWFRLNSDEMD